MDGRILTCVYCGQAYPQDTPAHGSQVLTDHIRVCEKHPMRKAEADIAMPRAALVGLIGVDGEDELRQMEATMRLLPAPDADKAVSINAIHALLATVPPNALGEGRERGILREASSGEAATSTDGLEGKGRSDAG